MPVICQTCHKWKTEDNAGNEAWKYYYNMTPEEQNEVDNTKKMFEQGRTRHHVIKCPDCAAKTSNNFS